MFLKHHIIIAAVQDIEAYIRLLRVLFQVPAAVCDHGGPAVIACFIGAPFDHQRHIVEIGVAVADKEDG